MVFLLLASFLPTLKGQPVSMKSIFERADTHWAFQPIRKPIIPASVHAYLEEQAPDAYAKMVDQLLDSPRFGERWGRHWLDVARYADTKGYLAGGESRAYPYAYTYRDWVIKALNEDLPYDEFIRKQMAADFLTDQPNHPDLAALGFLTVGPVFLNRNQ